MIINIKQILEYFLEIWLFQLIWFVREPKHQYLFQFVYSSTKNQTEFIRNGTELIIRSVSVRCLVFTILCSSLGGLHASPLQHQLNLDFLSSILSLFPLFVPHQLLMELSIELDRRYHRRTRLSFLIQYGHTSKDPYSKQKS